MQKQLLYDGSNCLCRPVPLRSSSGTIFSPVTSDEKLGSEAACSTPQDTEATAGDANMDDSAEAGGGAAPSDGGAAAADAAAEAADAAGERPAGAADGAATTTPMETEEQAAQPAATTTVKKRTKKIPVPVKAETASIPDPVVQVRTCAKHVYVGSICNSPPRPCLRCIARAYCHTAS